MTRTLTYGFLAVAIVLPALEFATSGLYLLVFPLIAFGLVWGLRLRRWHWMSSLGLFVVLGFTAVGLWIDLSRVLLYTGAFASLLVWDLTDFSQRLKMASPDDDIPGMERRHFLRLFWLALVSAALIATASLVDVKFSFELAVIMVIFGVWGVGRVVNWLRRTD